MQTVYAHDERGTRTDVHRPSAINPGDYRYLKVSEARAELKQGQKRGGPGGICHHCGKGIVWEVHFQHLPSGNVVTFGYICAGMLEMTDNRIDHEMNLLKRAAANEVKKTRFEKTRQDRFDNFTAVYHDEWQFIQDHADENSWLARIKWGVETYGSPFDDQIAAVQRYIAGYYKMIDAKLAEAKLLENAPNLVEGRQQIEGTIVGTKLVPGYTGGWDKKMTVKLDDGNKVYGTMPRSIEDAINDEAAEKGTRVRFIANVQPKEDHFGYFSRPTKGEVV